MKTWQVFAPVVIITSAIIVAQWIVIDQTGRQLAQARKDRDHATTERDAMANRDVSNICTAWYFNSDLQTARKRICERLK